MKTKNRFRFHIARLIGAPFRWHFRYRIEGKEHIPRGGCVFAFNHPGRADGWIVYIHMPREVIFLAKKELYDSLFKYPLKAFGHISIERGNGNSTKAIKQAVAFVKKGHAFGIFPEGGCIGAPKLRYLFTGAARVALEARVPIVPVAIIGSHGMLPDGAGIIYRLPKRKPVRVIIGKPLHYTKYYGKHEDRTVTRAVMDDVRTTIRTMLIYHHAPKAYWGPVVAKRSKTKLI